MICGFGKFVRRRFSAARMGPRLTGSELGSWGIKAEVAGGRSRNPRAAAAIRTPVNPIFTLIRPARLIVTSGTASLISWVNIILLNYTSVYFFRGTAGRGIKCRFFVSLMQSTCPSRRNIQDLIIPLMLVMNTRPLRANCPVTTFCFSRLFLLILFRTLLFPMNS